MDRIIRLFSSRLESMLTEYVNKIRTIPTWQLDNYLPEGVKKKEIDEKINFLTEKYKETNPIYKILQNDLNLLSQNTVALEDLKSVNLDIRYLESIGYKEDQIDDYYRFLEELKSE